VRRIKGKNKKMMQREGKVGKEIQRLCETL